jgi:uncharacterized protein (DUF2249 family)
MTRDATPDGPAELVGSLSRVLREALAALGRAGEPDEANRLAGLAWSALRHERPDEAQRINALMHGLSKLPSSADQPKEDSMATAELELDVRTEPPARRHELIFETYGALGAGEGFTLVNDHDPKPLYYQFAAEHAGEFSWDYLEEGPEVWKVRIGRT